MQRDMQWKRYNRPRTTMHNSREHHIYHILWEWQCTNAKAKRAWQYWSLKESTMAKKSESRAGMSRRDFCRYFTLKCDKPFFHLSLQNQLLRLLCKWISISTIGFFFHVVVMVVVIIWSFVVVMATFI